MCNDQHVHKEHGQRSTKLLGKTQLKEQLREGVDLPGTDRKVPKVWECRSTVVEHEPVDVEVAGSIADGSVDDDSNDDPE